MSISTKYQGVRIAALKSPVKILADKSSTLVFDTVKQIFWTQIMLKKTLLVASTAIVLAAASSVPAFANADPFANLVPDPVQTVPEPMTVFGLIAVAGGGLLATKRSDSKKAD